MQFDYDLWLAGWLVCIFLIRFIVWIKNILIEYSNHRRMIVCILVHDPLTSIQYWMFCFFLFGIVAGRRIDNLLGITNLFNNAHFFHCRLSIQYSIWGFKIIDHIIRKKCSLITVLSPTKCTKSVTVVAFYNNFTIFFFGTRKTYKQQPVGSNSSSFENG